MFRVIKQRRTLKVLLGDGLAEALCEQKDQKDFKPYRSKYFALTQAVRTHANFVENAPLLLLIVGLGEFNGMSKQLVHLLLGTFMGGRILHYFGLQQTNLVLRTLGTISILGPCLVASAISLYLLTQ
ncbi:membrane-associated, eicosanoid/glutathione metabolism protein [Gorgonomyces haynaldii]|nr:membrane-associated, eicosanoid/glutathione metabolism protein [Gorgonomyces haynaldii]